MKIGARGHRILPPYILITVAGAWILITLISGRCAQLSVQCSRQLTDTQSIRNGRLKWQVHGSYTGRCGRCGRCVVYTDRCNNHGLWWSRLCGRLLMRPIGQTTYRTLLQMPVSCNKCRSDSGIPLMGTRVE